MKNHPRSISRAARSTDTDERTRDAKLTLLRGAVKLCHRSIGSSLKRTVDLGFYPRPRQRCRPVRFAELAGSLRGDPGLSSMSGSIRRDMRDPLTD